MMFFLVGFTLYQQYFGYLMVTVQCFKKFYFGVVKNMELSEKQTCTLKHDKVEFHAFCLGKYARTFYKFSSHFRLIIQDLVSVFYAPTLINWEALALSVCLFVCPSVCL